MKVKVNRNFYNFLIYFICIYGIEIILRIVRRSSIFNYPMLRMIISSSILSLAISLLVCLIKKDKTRKIVNCIIIFVIEVYAVLQMGFYVFLGTYISFNASSQAYKVVDYLYDFLNTIPWQYYFVFIPFVALLICYIVLLPLSKKFWNFEIEEIKGKRTSKKIIIISFTFLALIGLYYGTLKANFMKSKYQIESNIEVFRNPENQSIAVDQFGVTMFFVIDINNFIFKYDGETAVTPSKPVIPERPVTDNSRDIDDTAWLKYIEVETNKNYAALNNYFIERNVTSKNEYTGMFEGKNVIFVLMESTNLIPFSEMVKDKFPTLNKLYNDGMTFTNFFSPRSSCSTGNNEMSAMIGLYPINNNCTANAYKSNKYPESVFNMFKKIGYSASSYHNYMDAYYSRGTIHTNMGSDKYYNASALKIPYKSVYQEWPSDTLLFEKGMPYYINDDKFMAFMTTVTSHQPYSVGSEFGEKNIDLFSDLGLSKSLQRYLSKAYELEKGLTIMLENLEKAGKLEDTVIVLFGDHYPYFFSPKHLTSILGEEVQDAKNVERTPLIIYNAGTESKKVETYATIIDILPTIFNLFGIDYDPRLYLGNDLFDDTAEHIAYFIDGSWQNEKGYYNASNGAFTAYNDDDTYTDDKIVSINIDITNKLKYSALALKTDYMNRLFTQMAKYKTVDEPSSSDELSKE